MFIHFTDYTDYTFIIWIHTKNCTYVPFSSPIFSDFWGSKWCVCLCVPLAGFLCHSRILRWTFTKAPSQASQVKSRRDTVTRTLRASVDTSEAFDHSVLSDSPRGLWWQCRLSSSLVGSAGQWAVFLENDNGAWRLLVNAWWIFLKFYLKCHMGHRYSLHFGRHVVTCSLAGNRRFQALATGELVPSLKDLGSVLWKDRASKAATSLTKMEQVWKRRRPISMLSWLGGFFFLDQD